MMKIQKPKLRKPLTLHQWMFLVDQNLLVACGKKHADLPKIDYEILYREGYSPIEATIACLDNVVDPKQASEAFLSRPGQEVSNA